MNNINKKDNYITLKKWLNSHNSNHDSEIAEFQKLFYNMDLNMKNIHERGYYITDFNINNILISDNKVKFNGVKKLFYEDQEYFIRKNIFYMSCLAIGVYNDCLNYINPENSKSLKDNFQYFTNFIPADVVPYYKGIVERDARVYLSDYVKAKVAQERKKEQSLLDISGQNSSSSKSSNMVKSKSTLVGRLYSDDNTAAFVQIVLFPVIIILLSILIPIFIIINS